jgi:hypothetical protein
VRALERDRKGIRDENMDGKKADGRGLDSKIAGWSGKFYRGDLNLSAPVLEVNWQIPESCLLLRMLDREGIRHGAGVERAVGEENLDAALVEGLFDLDGDAVAEVEIVAAAGVPPRRRGGTS